MGIQEARKAKANRLGNRSRSFSNRGMANGSGS